jgi:hypothetical protein
MSGTSENPLIAMIQARGAELTARADVALALSKAGEGSSTGIELDLIGEEIAFLTTLAHEVLEQRPDKLSSHRRSA